MVLKPKVKKIFVTSLTAILAATSIVSGYLIYQQKKPQININNDHQKNQNDQPITSNDTNPVSQELDLQSVDRISLINDFNQKEKLLEALSYHNVYNNVVYQIDEEKIQPILKEIVHNAILANQKGLVTSSEFHGKIYFKINNLDLSVDVVAQWNDQIDAQKKYYDHFQINFMI
ncbi:hypothetical protein MCAV_03100 [[Mycoplasma] cavipharyngis]|uniref:hypothetical protein n=1 Tax=[Mycoplasma] cavipharyngis TaxID=92757 RepID=UPI003703D2ED